MVPDMWRWAHFEGVTINLNGPIVQVEHDWIKGALCSLGEGIQTRNLNIYNISVVIMQTKKDLFLNNKAVLRGKQGPQGTV